MEKSEQRVRKTIVFVINSIGYGGAERVLSNILNSIGARLDHYDVHLILLDNEYETRSMPDYVKKHVLDSRSSPRRSIMLLVRSLSQLRPALVVSLLVRANVASAIAGKFLGLPVIICERMHLSSHLESRYAGVRLWLALAAPKLAYQYARRVLGVSTGVTDDLVEHFGVERSRAVTIFNPYDLEAIKREASHEPEIVLPERFIIAVGRLNRGKNFSQLIEAFLQARLQTSLVILGEGPERDNLEQLIKAYGAQERIFLPGYVRNPFSIAAKAEFFVASSINEGFPNAMVEAMILGRPIVASDCRSGPAEILGGSVAPERQAIIEAEYGILVSERSVGALAEGMIRMNEPSMLHHYARRGEERARQFDIARISQQYWTLFDEIAEKPNCFKNRQNFRHAVSRLSSDQATAMR